MRIRTHTSRHFSAIEFACLVMILACHGWSVAQQPPETKPEPLARSRTPVRLNPDISRIVREVDARNIERTIRKLVSFGTRNTLSVQDDPHRGIGAARDWLYSEFLKVAEQTGGRMTVEKQAYEQQKTARVLRPTVITNIVATLKGSQPASVSRVYVVSGHYDSM